MYFIWIITALQQGIVGFKKYVDRNTPPLPPHFTPPLISEQPLPTPETCSYTYQHRARVAYILRNLFLTSVGISLATMILLHAKFETDAFAISAGIFFYGSIARGLAWVAYRNLRRIRFYVGTSGLIAQYPSLPTLVARWSDIACISVEPNKRIEVELWDRTKYVVICPKPARKETGRMIQAHLQPERYAKADQLVRQWAIVCAPVQN
jgi:hypothetical protein